MPRRKPSIWQFSHVLRMEETDFRIKMAQAEAENSSVKLIKGSNVTASEQITEQINETNHQLKKKKIDLSSALNKLHNINANAMDDPKFAKLYPIITNQNLLEELMKFIELPPKKIKGVGIANGVIFEKQNGRQISGSNRYVEVLEADGTYNIYKQFKCGPLNDETCDIDKKKSSKRLAKSVISSTLSPQPVLTPIDNKPQHECNTTKCGTPLANRLRKRKTTSSCGGSASSIKLKKRRR
ncbi:unnamed protein product [Adineta steineri]|uniref:Uncharacterized protein n=1 Tax=Adineta steineri TaxID=433720 RepID=A0A819C3R7_9BILA|nr:unnamed protein product [Adineta steineri]CAF4111533.1 unnamed protein product [Adineta steineri]